MNLVNTISQDDIEDMHEDRPAITFDDYIDYVDYVLDDYFFDHVNYFFKTSVIS